MAKPVEVRQPEVPDEKEWLIANRLGSFAMGSRERIAFRRYHGLLVARLPELETPLHILAEVNETLCFEGHRYELGAFHFRDAIHPLGHLCLVGFAADPNPCWHYRCGKVDLFRTLEIHPKRHAVRLTYRIENAPPDAEILLQPHFTCRQSHQLQVQTPLLDGRSRGSGGRISFQFFQQFPEVFLDLSVPAPFAMDGFWNLGVWYGEEARRGYPDREDLFCPGSFRVPLAGNSRFSLSAGLDPSGSGDGYPKPRPRKAAGVDFRARLERAAAAFVVKLAAGPGILAGYPWFAERAREALIALPGLTMVRGKPAEASKLLDRFGRDLAASRGFPADLPLWYIRAVQQLETLVGAEAAAPFAPRVLELLESLRHQRPRGIHVRTTGTLYASSRHQPMTWMNAMVEGQPVTPRSPFAVEINALFYNAVRYALVLAQRLANTAFPQFWQPVAQSFEANFFPYFWMEDEGYLADAYTGSTVDPALRPNQLFAIGLPFSAVPEPAARAVLDTVRRRLLTPVGLRGLDPRDPHYHGVYAGDETARDLIYHQGPVWPWLFGPYIDAVRAVEGADSARAEAAVIIESMAAHLDHACLGQVSELFDGDPPHHPRGAPAFAPSVAELLRLSAILHR